MMWGLHPIYSLPETNRQIVLELMGPADHVALSGNLLYLYMQLLAVKSLQIRLQLPKRKSHYKTRTRAHLKFNAASCKILCFNEAFVPVVNLVQS